MKRNYHQSLKNYRKMGDTLQEVADARGNTVYLNFTKRLFKGGKPYKNDYYQREFIRFMKQKKNTGETNDK